jgi:hypothetical protein
VFDAVVADEPSLLRPGIHVDSETGTVRFEETRTDSKQSPLDQSRVVLRAARRCEARLIVLRRNADVLALPGTPLQAVGPITRLVLGASWCPVLVLPALASVQERAQA